MDVQSTKPVRTRVAPSPTGFPHLGLVYQAMFDYVFAKKYGGKFILRIEDTDRNRFVEGAEEVIYNSLDWVNLQPDESPRDGGQYGPYKQSERLDLYKKYTQELIAKGLAYRCFCTKERLDQMRKEQEAKHVQVMYDKVCLKLSEDEIKQKIGANEPFAVRMKISPDQKITVHDEIVGDIVFETNQIDDQVILKTDGFPTYHLAMVVDDYLMKITHVFRGTEWVPSFPKHVLLWQYLGWESDMPKFIHVPVLLNSEGGGKLSKRHAHTSVNYYRDEGFLPEAVVNYLANIVWNHPDGIEIFPLMDFAKAFDTDKKEYDIKSQGVHFDLKKLEWVNGEYIRKMDDTELSKRLFEYLISRDNVVHPNEDQTRDVIPLVKERMKKLSEFSSLSGFIFAEPKKEDQEILSIYRGLKIEDGKKVGEQIIQKLEILKSTWNAASFQETFIDLAKQLNITNFQIFQFIRLSVSGSLVTPPLFESIDLMNKYLGADEAVNRVKSLVDII